MSINLFNEQHIYRTRCQAIKDFHNYNFLSLAIEQELAERALNIIQQPSSVLLHGIRTSILPKALQQNTVIYDQPLHDLSLMQQDRLSIYDDHSFDLIVDASTLHTINDVPQILQTYRQLLRPRGTFIAAFYGGETLRELRDSLVEVELALKGGAALRVIPMIDLSSALKLLQHTGFHHPIVDREINTINYDFMTPLLRDIRGMGEHEPFIELTPSLRHKQLQMVASHYKKHYSDFITAKLLCTVEIIYLKGDAP